MVHGDKISRHKKAKFKIGSGGARIRYKDKTQQNSLQLHVFATLIDLGKNIILSSGKARH